MRLGRVTSIEPDRITLEQGSIPTGPTVLQVDRSAAGIPTPPSTTVFAGDRHHAAVGPGTCQPTFRRGAHRFRRGTVR